MRVKIFQASGAQQIQSLELEINEWLAELDGQGGDIVSHNVTACGVGEHGDETYQAVIVFIWYAQAGYRTPPR